MRDHEDIKALFRVTEQQVVIEWTKIFTVIGNEVKQPKPSESQKLYFYAICLWPQRFIL